MKGTYYQEAHIHLLSNFLWDLHPACKQTDCDISGHSLCFPAAQEAGSVCCVEIVCFLTCRWSDWVVFRVMFGQIFFYFTRFMFPGETLLNCIVVGILRDLFWYSCSSSFLMFIDITYHVLFIFLLTLPIKFYLETFMQ